MSDEKVRFLATIDGVWWLYEDNQAVRPATPEEIAECSDPASVHPY